MFAHLLQGQLLPNSSGAPLLKQKLLALNPETLQKWLTNVVSNPQPQQHNE